MNIKLANSIPVSLKHLLFKLHFLSQIDRGHKPNLSDMSLVESTSWFGALTRSFKGESRKTMLASTEKIIEETIEAINIYSSSDYLPLLIHRLYDARRGIDSLKTTYHNDHNTKSRISVILDDIDIQLEKYRHHLIDHPKDDPLSEIQLDSDVN